MPLMQGLQHVQGTGVEMYSAQPGLVSSPLYSKGDHGKATMWAVEFFQSFYGQAPVRGCRSLLRAATDPELIGQSFMANDDALAFQSISIHLLLASHSCSSRKYVCDMCIFWQNCYRLLVNSRGLVHDYLAVRKVLFVTEVAHDAVTSCASCMSVW